MSFPSPPATNQTRYNNHLRVQQRDCLSSRLPLLRALLPLLLLLHCRRHHPSYSSCFDCCCHCCWLDGCLLMLQAGLPVCERCRVASSCIHIHLVTQKEIGMNAPFHKKAKKRDKSKVWKCWLGKGDTGVATMPLLKLKKWFTCNAYPRHVHCTWSATCSDHDRMRFQTTLKRRKARRRS